MIESLLIEPKLRMIAETMQEINRLTQERIDINVEDIYKHLNDINERVEALEKDKEVIK